MEDDKKDNYKEGYGKRPLWQWIVIYLIIGLIVYGLIYYFVLAGRSSSSSVNQPQQQQQQPGY